MLETKVLDHGLIRLVDTMPKMGQEGVSGDLSVVRAARISHDAAWRAGEDTEADLRLMRRLWSGQSSSYTGPLPALPKHSTPFEAVTMTFEIFAPIFVFRQWHRHRTQSYNELSARYRELPEVYYTPTPDQIGSQSTSNKQGRRLGDEEMYNQRSQELGVFDEHCQSAFKLYQHLLSRGWPRELARCVLPFGTYSHMFTTMNLLNFFKFANLRADAHAQYEIRVYAEAMIGMVGMLAPVATNLFLESNLAIPNL
jgi:thymidylate synthase (FAD)